MRIALVTQRYEQGGGVRTIARWLKSGMELRGHQVHVFDLASSRSDANSRRILSPRTWRRSIIPIRSESDPDVQQCGANWVEFETQRYLPRRALTSALNGYDIVQVVAGGPALAEAVSGVRRPTLLQVATTMAWERPARIQLESAMRRAYENRVLRSLRRMEYRGLHAVDRVLVENREMEKWVRERRKEGVHLVPPGVDTGIYTPAATWSARRPVVAFGRLDEPRKNWAAAISAFEKFLDDTNAPNDLVIAGRGPMTAHLVNRVQRSRYRNRIATSIDVPPEEVASLLRGGSVLIQSSLEEGLGIAGLEGMACGLPVVATDTAGAREYVASGVNGVLVDMSGDIVAGLAEGLQRVLLRPDGPQLSGSAVDTCRERYSSDASLSRFERLYIDLLSHLEPHRI